MSFRKRNVGLSGPSLQSQSSASEVVSASTPGVRPSPLDGRPTTSTGTFSLDDLLGHSGFALGNSILIEENGTTEFGATLLRYFAAEGVVQGHKVHVLGVGEPWGRELPGVVRVGGDDVVKPEKPTPAEKDRMKIAWRYERLGDFGTGPSNARAHPAVNRAPILGTSGQNDSAIPASFCHTFDLTKRLAPSDCKGLSFIPIRPVLQHMSPYQPILQALREQLASNPSTAVHRLVIPNLLSPALYPANASSPQHVLQFLHSLRALLRQYSTKLAVMMTLPLMLYPRSTGLTRWMELLSDGVVELSPFPHLIDTGATTTMTSGNVNTPEEKPQGMVKVHRRPVFSEKGGGGALSDDLVFTVSRRKFVIKPFNLPPVEGDAEAQRGEGEGKPTKVDIEF
ncbi:MAG: hypothetical protein L6R40_007330 [Gallowayella cf. fulva]|nr:MAG: hypothetical protein L6R40_007330 [Xanthomendoza cf. fulva]